ncbi:MAG: hypothetical protein K6B12_01605 [Clostridiales bacterium]|nr:hypothetical protein [Clostridiales bacterium]
MEKIKDFFYNKNDVLIALLILACAAAVIYFRVRAIMAYPQQQMEDSGAVIDMAKAAFTMLGIG